MAVGGRNTYFIRGAHPIATGDTLEEALADLLQFWESRPSLLVHEMGNIVIVLQIGGTTITLEVTDVDTIDRLRDIGPQTLVDELAEQMGIDRADARQILDEATATVQVDTIRVPHDPNAWTTDPGLEPATVLPAATMHLIGEMTREADEQARRSPGRPRSVRGRELVRMAIRAGQQLGLSDGQISQETGIPRSTVRDTRLREERIEQAAEVLRGRAKGQRLTEEQRQLVLQELQNSDDNAAEAARRLGLSPRTVREIRQRARQAAATEGIADYADATVTPVRHRYTAEQKQALLDLVRDEHISATEAGRQLGVPARTARDWVRKDWLGE